MTQAHVPTDWHPASWQNRHAAQQPTYRDRAHLETVLGQLAQLPPIVTTWEVENLKGQLARAQRGEAFLLQGGDCAENFDECTSDNVVQKLKILLQMSLVMVLRFDGAAWTRLNSPTDALLIQAWGEPGQGRLFVVGTVMTVLRGERQ